jgi:hypothetical protein
MTWMVGGGRLGQNVKAKGKGGLLVMWRRQRTIPALTYTHTFSVSIAKSQYHALLYLIIQSCLDALPE